MLRRGAVGLGNGDGAVLHAQQLHNGQVLAGLRHHAVVGGNYQQYMVYPHSACHHGVHKFLVAGHVDHAQRVAVGQRHIGVAQLNRYAARLLFFQAVGLDASQCAHQGGLAMVNMASGS